MALFINSFNFMIQNEDATQAHAIVSDSPPGAFAISGINSAAFPVQYAAIAALPQNERGPAVENFYQTVFWNKWLEQITSDAVAMRVFDAAVNMGPIISVKLLQEAINTLILPTIIVDGVLGTHTISATNLCEPALLVTAFQNTRCAHYEAIVAKNPADEKYLNAWIVRAKK